MFIRLKLYNSSAKWFGISRPLGKEMGLWVSVGLFYQKFSCDIMVQWYFLTSYKYSALKSTVKELIQHYLTNIFWVTDKLFH